MTRAQSDIGPLVSELKQTVSVCTTAFSEQAPVSHTPTARLGNRGKKQAILERVCIGPIGALEKDREYQRKLLEEWKKNQDGAEGSSPAVMRHTLQFLNFLSDPSQADGVVPHATQYIHEAFGDSTFLCIEDLDAELTRFSPEVDQCQVVELNKVQMTRLKDLLRDFTRLHGPPGLNNDIVYRPTFCRFLVDTGLITYEAWRTEQSLPYHRALRFFDAVARSPMRTEGSPGVAQTATIDQCAAVTTQLLGQLDLPSGAAWNLFEQGLEKAREASELSRLSLARMAETVKERMLVTKAPSVVRRAQSFDKLSPPMFFEGSCNDWLTGVRAWARAVNMKCDAETVAEHCQASHNYLRDMLLEPGSVHVSLKFRPVFNDMFGIYRDGMRLKHFENELGVIGIVREQHMSFAAFFRFCIDFAIFPTLCSFEDIWFAYAYADCVEPLGTLGKPVKPASMKPKSEESQASSRQSDASEESAPFERSLGPTRSDASALTAHAAGKRLSVGHMGALSRTFANGGLRTRTRSKGSQDDAVSRCQSKNSSTAKKGKALKPSNGSRRPSIASWMAEEGVGSESALNTLLRIKPKTDFSWVWQATSDMTDLEQRAYGVLYALMECTADHFMNVRQLFASVGEFGRGGDLLTAEEVSRALAGLYVEHTFPTVAEMKEFAKVVDPKTDGILDIFELDKAVDVVREKENPRPFQDDDEGKTLGASSRMRPGNSSQDVSKSSAEARRRSDVTRSVTLGIPARPAATITITPDAQHLGAEARRRSETTRSYVAFGSAAFVEALLKLAFLHMHVDGVASKASMPGGIRGYWLIAFLHYRFDMIRSAKLGTTDDKTQRRASKLGEVATAWSHTSIRASSNSNSVLNVSMKFPDLTKDSRVDADKDTQYKSLRVRLIDQHPRLFEDRGEGDHGLEDAWGDEDESSSGFNITQMAKKTCSVCSRQRDARGFGSVFCHACSGVDNTALRQSAVYPIFCRRVIEEPPPPSEASVKDADGPSHRSSRAPSLGA